MVEDTKEILFTFLVNGLMSTYLYKCFHFPNQYRAMPHYTFDFLERNRTLDS